MYYNCEADVSRKTCLDVIYHYDTDILRHLSHQVNGVDPAKHIAYLVFWVRKLKPISEAYYSADITQFGSDEKIVMREIHDINERASVSFMKHLLLACSKAGLIGFTDAENQIKQCDLIEEYFDIYQKNKADLLSIQSDGFHSLIYDMRYRTFGPHHFTHLVNNVIYFVNTQMSVNK